MTTNAIDELRDNIRKLKATGPDGFEGLIAVVLSDITKNGFSLAKSGSQRGKDGETIYDPGSITFEGKRYDGAIPKNEVLSKISEIAVDDTGITDLWILGATTPISSQDNTSITSIGKKVGIGTLILDWSDNSLSGLATLLAMAKDLSVSFIADRITVSEAAIERGLSAVRAHPQFSDRQQQISEALDQPSIGPAYSLKKNGEYLRAAFGNRCRAKAVFGQALAPGDSNIPGILDRKELREKLAGLVFSKPNDRIAAILGSDGNGKSWLFGQCWLNQAPKPLTVVIVPEDIKEPFSLADVEPLLISKLIAQTGDTDTGVPRERWRRHLERWRRTKPENLPRMVAMLDGLNQRESIYWAQVVNTLALVLSELGAKLVISARTPFFRNHLQDKLANGVDLIEVPEWSTPELETLLVERGSSITNLKPQVAEFLRNPRIFAVAAELFKAGRIEAFGELSVSRLLFEHIRMGASPAAELLSASEFVRGVRLHAGEIVNRLQTPNPIDTTIFTRNVGPSEGVLSIEEQFRVTSAGRFFEEVPGDSTLYSVRDEGLPLALGLFLLSNAQTALRNNQCVGEQLSKILDPIAALDKTADVLLSAVIAAVLSDSIPIEIIGALAAAFVSLQNLDADRFPEFRGLVKEKPAAFLRALEDAALSEGITSNLSWVNEALLANRGDAAVWAAITTAAQRWLSMYSLAPERMVYEGPVGSDKWRESYNKSKDELSTKRAALTDAEHAILSQLVLEERGNYSKLNEAAIDLLAGQPLKAFGEAFRNWCFANSFNGGIQNKREDLYHLIQLNRVDWVETRDVMLAAVKDLRGADVSETGRWALASALSATADQAAAKEAISIIEDLTKDRERFPGWRLIETWCATDPCDPTSEKPENITATAERYKQLDVTKLRTSLGRSQEDHFFEGSLAGLVRFESEAAIETMRRFANHLVVRDTPDFRIGAFLLESHTAALGDDVASAYLAKANAIGEELLAGTDPHNEGLIASQYAMMIAFPHISGDQQLAALTDYVRVENILLSLCDLMQDADPIKYEEALDKAYAAADTILLSRLMSFTAYTETQISPRARTIIGELASSIVPLVRLCALGAVRRLNDPVLLKLVVDSGWSAKQLDAADANFEIWYGSQVLVLAAEKNLISIDDCINRISLGAFSDLVHRVGVDAAHAVADRIDVARKVAARHVVKGAFPHIEQRIGDRERPDIYDIDDRPDHNENPANSIRHVGETSVAFYERHERNRKVLEQLERELSSAGANLIIDTLTPALLEELYLHVPEHIKNWHSAFHNMSDLELRAVHNLAIPVMQVIAKEDPAGAVEMFERLARVEPFVHVTFGSAKISLGSVSLWKADDNDEIRALRFRRLDQALTDAEIALEVLAADHAGKVNQLKAYVLDRRARPEPVYIARALMVAGFSPEEPWALETIEAYKDAAGFLSDAYDAAKYAMERHQWSKHWAMMMRDAKTPAELWRYAILLAVIVDGRFIENRKSPNTWLIDRFGPTFNDMIHSRIEKWKGKREKTLFGKRVPDARFLRQHFAWDMPADSRRS